MPTINLSDALREAYAVADTTAIEYYTFEWIHPSWDPPVFTVHGWDEIEALIEDPSDSPKAGELVTFQPLPIEGILPPTTADEVPSFQFRMYDPSRIVAQKIIEAQNDPKPIQMLMRVYLSNRLTVGPETQPVPRYYVGSTRLVKKTGMVTGRCVFQDYMGRSAPFTTYTPAEFPGLKRR